MPDSMYEKLGELLYEAIESGNFFSRNPASEGKKSQENTKDCIQKSTQAENSKQKDENDSKTVYNSVHNQNEKSRRIVQKNKKLIKHAHSSIQKACTFVGITNEMSYEDAKKQFRKKLLRFHPDRNADNEVMRKITREKTEELLQAWKIIEDWFRSE